MQAYLGTRNESLQLMQQYVGARNNAMQLLATRNNPPKSPVPRGNEFAQSKKFGAIIGG